MPKLTKKAIRYGRTYGRTYPNHRKAFKNNNIPRQKSTKYIDGQTDKVFYRADELK